MTHPSHRSVASSDDDDLGPSPGCRKLRLLGVHQIPTWQRDNDYIHTGYRVQYGWSGALRSLCTLHNETMNVWTHLVGALSALVLLILTLLYLSPYGLHRAQELVQHSLGVLPPHIHHTHHSSLHRQLHHHMHLQQCASDLVSSVHNRSPWTPSPVLWPLCVAQDDFVEDLPEAIHEWDDLTQSGSINGHEGAYKFLGTSMKDSWSNFKEKLQALSQRTARLVDTGKHEAKAQWMKTSTAIDGAAAKFGAALAGATSSTSGSLHDLEKLHAQVYTQFEHLQHSISHDLRKLDAGLETSLNAVLRAMRQYGTGIFLLKTFSPTEKKQGLLSFLPRWPLMVFLVSAAICMGMSAFYHLFSAVSRPTSILLQRLDYAGISLLISGSTVPVVYYGFLCDPSWRMMYVVCIGVVGMLGTAVSLFEWFNRSAFRHVRVFVFVSMGVLGAVPLWHMCSRHGEVLEVFNFLLCMAAFYLLGAALYAMRIPERCGPGHFDNCGASHQLFHICVFAAVLTHYIGLLRFYEWRIHTPCPPMED